MTKEEIKRNLSKALNILYEKDFYLIKEKAHERTITHMLALHLVNFFPEYDIDCEYDIDKTNLDGEYPGKKEIEILIKDLEKFKNSILQSPNRKFTVEDLEIFVHLNIYPDIIIHKRGTNESNILVIELKKSTNFNNKSHELDRIKLKAYTSERLKYQIGAFINLSVSENFKKEQTEIEYYENGGYEAGEKLQS
jgi:hypothetical protein